MEELGSWLIPLTYLPGIGMLLLSTSHRANALDDQLHQLLKEEPDLQAKLLEYYVRRTMLFRNSLIGLYVSLAFFLLSSILGIMAKAQLVASTLIELSAIVGTLCVFYAVMHLVFESVLSMKTNRARCLVTPGSFHYLPDWKPPWRSSRFSKGRS